MPKFGSQIDALKISIKGFIPESSSTAPTSPAEGQGWHDTAGKVWNAYLNGGWRGIVDYRRQVATGAGLTGGGDLSVDRTLAVDFAADGGGTSSQVPRATDTRLSNSRPPNGAAGGDLTGSYPNPTVANGAITDAKVAAANKDGAAATPSLRTLGTGAQQAMAGNTRLDTIAAPTSPVSLNNQRITALADPTAATDAANRRYVDQRVQGAEWKDSVRLISTVDTPLTGGATSADGVSLQTGDRILLAGQSAAAENGIYVYSATGNYTRASDANDAGELTPNTAVFVEEGNTLADTGWTLTTNGTITIGTTAQTWTQFTGVGTLIAGAGLVRSGNTLDVVAADSSISVTADAITVGLVPVAKGGTGATTSAQAAVNLSIVRTLTGTLNLTAGTWTDLGTEWGQHNAAAAVASFYLAGERIELDTRVNSSTLQVRADVALSNVTWTALSRRTAE